MVKEIRSKIMALGPSVLTELTPQDTSTVERIEQFIDARLRTADNQSGHVSIGVDIPNSRVREELRKRYIKAGWGSVEFRTLGREEDESIELWKSTRSSGSYQDYQYSQWDR